MTEARTVQPGDQVTFHCSITLKDGTVAETTFADEPIQITMGDDSVLLNGLQLAMYGMKVGDKEKVWIEPADAYGMPEDEAIQTLPLSDFPDSLKPEVGQIIAFSTPSGEEIPGAVTEIEGDQVTVDFNHPLAGHEIQFEVEILEITTAH